MLLICYVNFSVLYYYFLYINNCVVLQIEMKQNNDMDYVCVVLSIVFISIQNMKIISQHNYFSMVMLHPVLYYKL